MTKVKSFQSFLFESELFMKLGEHSERVGALQGSLEKLGFKLSQYGIDGKFGPETLMATKTTLQTIASLTNLTKIVSDPNVLSFAPDGITELQYNICVMVGKRPEMAQAIVAKMHKSKPSQQNTNSDSMVINDIIQKNVPDSDQFMAKLSQVSTSLGIDPNWLLAVMYKESRLKSTAYNAQSGATGLIQFLPNTASGLGTTTSALRKMSATQQLDYVYKYLSTWKGKMKSVIDVYLAVFYPAAVGHPDNWVIGSQVSQANAEKIASRNPAISNGKPTITKADFKQYVTRDLPADLAQAV